MGQLCLNVICLFLDFVGPPKKKTGKLQSMRILHNGEKIKFEVGKRVMAI